MQSFISYLLEAEDKKIEISNIGDREGFSKLEKVDSNLKILIKRIFEIAEEINVKIEKISIDPSKSAGTRGGKAGYRTKIYVADIGRKTREETAKDILNYFNHGPRFIGTADGDPIRFVWFGGKDNIEKFLSSGNISKFEYGKKTLDNIVKQGSKSSRYSIALFSIENKNGNGLNMLKGLFDEKTRKDPDFWKDSIKIEEAKKESPEIKADCIVDFTVSTVEHIYDSKIKNTNELLKIVNIAALGAAKTTSEGYEGYTNVPRFKNKDEALQDMANSLNEHLDSISQLDKELYTAMFRKMQDSGERFDLNELKNTELSVDFISKDHKLTFEDVLGLKHYGVIVSETLIPFLLLCNIRQIKTIDGRSEPIINGLADYEIQSVEIPGNNNPLTDYDVIFVNAKRGTKTKRFAISAKFGDYFNHSSLVGLISRCRNQKAIDIASKDAYFEKIAKIAKERKSSTSEDIVKIYKAFEDEISKATPELLDADIDPVKADKTMVSFLNKKKDFLTTVYLFIFRYYYGRNVDFQQIELKKDLSIKKIIKRRKLDDKNISDLIELISVASYKKDASKDSDRYNVNQPLAVELK